jgi:hypothetical protein
LALFTTFAPSTGPTNLMGISDPLISQHRSSYAASRSVVAG